MENVIDCLFVGHNQTSFQEYEGLIRMWLGKNSVDYRNMELSFIRYKNSLYTISDIFNLSDSPAENGIQEKRKSQTLCFKDTFSLAIAYLCSFLHKNGLTFDFISSFNEEKEELIKKLKENEYRIIAIPTTFYINEIPIIEIISLIRHYSKAPIIIGGPFIAEQARTLDTEVFKKLLKTVGGDVYIISSQGEAALCEVIKANRDGKPLDSINNIAYRLEDSYHINPAIEENNPIDEGAIDWRLFKGSLKKFTNIRTSLSCPFRCAFCAGPQHAGEYRTMSVSTIEKELNSIKDAGGVKSVTFIDDTLNFPKERFKELLKMIVKNKYEFKWNCYYRCQFADRETVELMKESGCEGVFLGIESGNAGILKNMNKFATVEKYKEGLELLNEYEIPSYASFIIGFPGETAETVEDTIRFIECSRPTFYRAELWGCYKLAPILKEKEKYNITYSSLADWSHSTMDSNMACNMVSKVFSTVKNSIWVPSYGFDFFSILKLMHNGMDMEQIKSVINTFNTGIRENIESGRKEVSACIMQNIKNAAMIK